MAKADVFKKKMKLEKKYKNNFNYLKEDLSKIKHYLKPNWGFQNNYQDRRSNFVYRAADVDDILYEHSKNPFPDLNYTMRRYYNHKTSDAVESLFCSYNLCEAEKNKKHKYIDFYIMGVAFDLKVSSFPKRFTHKREDFKSEREYRNSLINWLYENQSKEGRYHTANRLFVVCKSGDGQDSYKNNLLKMEFEKIGQKVNSFLEYSANAHNNEKVPFNRLTLNDGSVVYSEVIFIED